MTWRIMSTSSSLSTLGPSSLTPLCVRRRPAQAVCVLPAPTNWPTVYLRIYFFGMPANLVYNFGAAILRAQGDTQRPLYFLTLAGVVNVALNLIFVIALNMDVAGVALATIIAQYISAALVVWCLMREQGPLRLELRRLGLEGRVVRRIIQVGLPAGFQGVVFSLSNVVIQSSLNSFDDAVLVAGSSASSKGSGSSDRLAFPFAFFPVLAVWPESPASSSSTSSLKSSADTFTARPAALAAFWD